MPKLLDAVQKEQKPAFDPLLDQLLTDLETRRQARSFVSPGQTLIKGDSVLKQIENMEERLEEERAKSFKAYGGNLPPEIEKTISITEFRRESQVDLDSEDHLTYASRKQKGRLGELRSIADKLGFLIAPVDFISDEIMDMAEANGINPAWDFNKQMKDGFDVYVLAPMSAYSINKHIADQEEKTIYWDLTNPTISAIEMMLPALKVLNGRVDALEDKVESIEKTVGRMDEQLARLEEQVAEQKRQEAIRRQENKAMAERLKRLQTVQFTRTDPLIFAVEKGTNIKTDDTFVILGPCWGEDFEDIVFASLGLGNHI